MDRSPIMNGDSIDLSFIGKNGLVIQYEDIVSLIGFNIIKYLRSKKINNKICEMSIKDILLSYFNRENEDISIWLKSFGIDNFNIADYYESINTFTPNLLYSFKIIHCAYENGIKNIIVHSNIESNVINKYLQFYDVPIKYTYGDIRNVLNENMNYTYITSSPSNIRKCLDVKVPIALTICDDFMYVADLLTDGTIEKLRGNNIFVQFTGILSGGFIKDN